MIRKIHQHNELCICICSANEFAIISKILDSEGNFKGTKTKTTAKAKTKTTAKARARFTPLSESVKVMQCAIRAGNNSRSEIKAYLKSIDYSWSKCKAVLDYYEKHGLVRKGEKYSYRYYFKGEAPSTGHQAPQPQHDRCGNPACGLSVPKGNSYCVQCSTTLINLHDKQARLNLEETWRSEFAKLEELRGRI